MARPVHPKVKTAGTRPAMAPKAPPAREPGATDHPGGFHWSSWEYGVTYLLMVKHGEKKQVDLQGGSSQLYFWLTGAKRMEFSGMIHFITSNNHPSNPQQPIHSLRNTSKLNMVKKKHYH